MATKRLLEILWPGLLIYIQEVFWVGNQGEGTSPCCTLFFSDFRTSFSFSLWLGGWDHFTRRTETFQKISNMYGYFFVHITLHEFSVNSRTWGEGGKMLRSSAQGVDPPVCRVLDVAVTYARDSFVDSPAGPFVFSRGSPDILDVTVTYARDSFCGFTGWAFVLSGGGGGRQAGIGLTSSSSSIVIVVVNLIEILTCAISKCRYNNTNNNIMIIIINLVNVILTFCTVWHLADSVLCIYVICFDTFYWIHVCGNPLLKSLHNKKKTTSLYYLVWSWCSENHLSVFG